MHRLALLLLASAPALYSHAISMSNGEVTVRGDRLDFVLTMPMYEAAHTPHPETAFLDHFRFGDGRLVQKSCHEDSAKATYVCMAEYAFPKPLEQLDVECTLYQVTVPNHVHLLRAERNGKHDQAVFDYSFTHATLRFRPPTVFETAVQQGFEGILRAVAGPVQFLLLAALVLAARSWRELVVLGSTFLAGEIAVALLAGRLNWQPPVRFVEAAMALSIAYLAVEILFLPDAGGRPFIAAVLGGFHGLSLYLLLFAGDFRPVYVLSGAVVAEIGVLAFLSVIRQKWMFTRLVQSTAGVLLVFGMTWFALRLRN